MTENKITRIIVEGPDCSGKSTLVERLKNRLQWDSKSLHHLPGDQFKRYLKEYANQECIVFDRSHYSEAVYSKLWRGDSAFSLQEKEILDQISKRNSLIIFAIPGLREIENRYHSRDFRQQIALPDLRKSYRYFKQEQTKSNGLLYLSRDYEELERLIEQVAEMIK